MFEEKSHYFPTNPPLAHAASGVGPSAMTSAYQQNPLDLAVRQQHCPYDLNKLTLTALANITTPPEVLPPMTSKFWDTPPPRLSDLTPLPPPPVQTQSIPTPKVSSSASLNQYEIRSKNHVSKYGQLLSVLEEMGKDIRPCYAGSKGSAERLKRGIVHARLLVREAIAEVEKSANCSEK